MEIKTKVNKWDLVKLKSFLQSITNKVKRQPSESEKTTARETTDKELISKIYRQLIQFSTRKAKQPNQKMGKGPEETFLQRRHTDG